MDNIISINICVDNAAFGVTNDDQAAEVARILRSTASWIEDFLTSLTRASRCVTSTATPSARLAA